MLGRLALYSYGSPDPLSVRSGWIVGSARRWARAFIVTAWDAEEGGLVNAVAGLEAAGKKV